MLRPCSCAQQSVPPTFAPIEWVEDLCGEAAGYTEETHCPCRRPTTKKRYVVVPPHASKREY